MDIALPVNSNGKDVSVTSNELNQVKYIALATNYSPNHTVYARRIMSALKENNINALVELIDDENRIKITVSEGSVEI